MSRYSPVSRESFSKHQFRAFHTEKPSIVAVALYRALEFGNTLISKPLQLIFQLITRSIRLQTKLSQTCLGALKRTILYLIGHLLTHNTKVYRLRNVEILTGAYTNGNLLPMRVYSRPLGFQKANSLPFFPHTHLPYRPSTHLHHLQLPHHQV